MARLDFEPFRDKEICRIYIAGELGEARRVEEILTRHAIDYAVEIEPYQKSMLTFLTLFSSGVYAGAAFFVLSGQAAFARDALLDAGLKGGIQDDDAEVSSLSTDL